MALIFTCTSVHAQNEEGSTPPNPEELAENETARLERELKLEDWQVFYVDSTLRHDYIEWMAEMQQLTKARVENSDLYLALQDKWMVRIEESYQRIFTPQQWNDYLKQGGERIISDRKKREAKRLKATESKKADEIRASQAGEQPTGKKGRKKGAEKGSVKGANSNAKKG